VRPLTALLRTAAVLLTATLAVPSRLLSAQSPPPTFRGGVDLVSLDVSVRDPGGAPVRRLTAADFIVLDRGEARALETARLESDGSIRAALVLDTSGSMAMRRTWTTAREVVRRVVALLDERRDEVALFAFDARLRLVRAFSTRRVPIAPLLDELTPFGGTSLYDSMAASIDRLGRSGDGRAALLVVTDGMDTSSRLAPGDAWAAATTLDAPSYVFVTETAVDARRGPGARRRRLGALADLARRTGGELLPVSGSGEVSAAAGRVVGDLRQRYVLAFEASAAPGWHPVEIRTRDPRLNVRARGGYWVRGPATR
jgi:VWFA-related protein